MLKLIWELFLWYLLYKFIFGFIIPVYRTTRQVKRQMNDMQARFNQQQTKQHSASTASQSTQPKQKPNHGDDYIEFEEVR